MLIRSTMWDQKHSPCGHNIYKYGRYCEGTDLPEPLDTAIEYDNKLIFADYQRFEQKGAPIDETHGGASLEEWLVPLLIIDNLDNRKKILILPPADQLRLNPATRNVTVPFSLDYYNGTDVSVRIRGKKIACVKNAEQYTFNYTPEKQESEIEADVYIRSEYVGSFQFLVKTGISQNKGFDLL